MPTVLSRPLSEPAPWPSDFQPDGSLWGDLPITVPRPRRRSMKIIIVKLENGITFYDVYPRDTAIRCKIDTKNERILLCSLNVMSPDPPYRLVSGDVPLARIVALQNPSTDPSRDRVDHADRDTTNDCSSNVRFVTPQFNAFNVARKVPASGFFEVEKNGSNFIVNHREIFQGRYLEAETAALVYNLVCRFSYGDQLDKTPDLLNAIKDEEERVKKISSLKDGVDIYNVDDTFLVVYQDQVKHYVGSLEVARKAADGLVKRLDEIRKKEEEKWADRRRWLKVCARSNGVAMIGLLDADLNVVEVLLDDDDWKEIWAREASLALTRNNRVIIRLKGGQGPFLSCWLCTVKDYEIVDHINGNIYDHQRINLRVVDCSTNRQNSRLAHRNESGYIGVRLLPSGGYRTTCRVRGENRSRSMNFGAKDLDKAVELYDLTSLHQFGPLALINQPHRREEYLAMLKQDETVKRVESFLSARTKSSSYLGVTLHLAKKRWLNWIASVEYDTRKTTSQMFSAGKTGAEVRAAICSDLFRLTLQARNLTVNFERMRPYYLFLIDTKGDWTKTPKDRKAVVELAYRRIGGDTFAKSLEDDEGVSAPDSVSASSSSSSSVNASAPSS
ncbi:uncharacterized protein SRS1_13756 [Sporisorium reilianum f. sp. reilianum]|uniref:Uncharacterized protein n=1 Tax=Sporisorium reilianum f. sp. reilianum TaxID=72559 RepID=A0A2N8UDW0_9BASI|nr:uncharacterized protein SRS1_13756 [Sporisorium reilianum f. sp. reilianum]